MIHAVPQVTQKTRIFKKSITHSFWVFFLLIPSLTLDYYPLNL